jgi:hypothetical protein
LITPPVEIGLRLAAGADDHAKTFRPTRGAVDPGRLIKTAVPFFHHYPDIYRKRAVVVEGKTVAVPLKAALYKSACCRHRRKSMRRTVKTIIQLSMTFVTGR